MPKRSSGKPPKLCQKDKTKAVVYYGGKTHYLGLHGSENALANYGKLCNDIAINPNVPPQSFTRQNSQDQGTDSKHILAELFSEYLDQPKFTRQNASVDGSPGYAMAKRIIEIVLKQFTPDLPTDSFTPKCLKKVQRLCANQKTEQGNWSRNYCNRMTSILVNVFKWGVSEELVKETTLHALKTVAPIQPSETDARETEPRQDVPDSVIEATLPYLLPTVAAMVRLQRENGMRPSEVFRMTVKELDRSRPDGKWVYQPSKHKTQHKGKRRLIVFGKYDQSIIVPFLVGKKDDDAVFSPKDAMRERQERDAENRKTKIQPSQIKRHKERMKNPKTRVGEHYTRSSYNRAIGRAIDRANASLPLDQQIPHWTPYQLRHTGITETVENENSAFAAQTLAGHSSSNTTARYDHSDQKKRLAVLAEHRDAKHGIAQKTTVPGSPDNGG